MLRLPVMVAAGGINSAGRSSQRHAYRRMVMAALPTHVAAETRAALSELMGTDDHVAQEAGTLVRPIESSHFDPRAVPWARRVHVSSGVAAELGPNQAPESLEAALNPRAGSGRRTVIDIAPDTEVLLPGTRPFEVSAAGQLPTGFDPASRYTSRGHPRALQMTVFAASDALADLGIEWSEITARVAPQAISVYVGSSMGQLDEDGTGGMLRGRATGRRVSSKQCPLGFAEMPGDFINAYVLRSMGNTGPAIGACATFLYNLRQGVADIRSGRARVAIVGAAEAPIVPEVMDGYVAMGALATDRSLRALDGLSDDQPVDARRACRPFGNNSGFTMAESAQVVVLFDDALALELGAPVLSGVPDVFVHADGPKKSISGPGAGNFITMARAAALLRGMLGEQRFIGGGLVQAHGTGTPQNRATESDIINRVAAAFGVSKWPVAAIKSYIGHSLGAAAGDQLSAMLGIWQTGIVPAISTIDGVADDVHTDSLEFLLRTESRSIADYAIVNSKGFGGNNASAALLSPDTTLDLLRAHHGVETLRAWARRHDGVQTRRAAIEAERLRGEWQPSYHFDAGVLSADDISVSSTELRLGDTRVCLEADVPQGWALS